MHFRRPRVSRDSDRGDLSDAPRPVLDATEPLAPLKVLAATPRLVWVLVAVQALLAGFYAVAVPVWHAPDEYAHVDLVRKVASGGTGREQPFVSRQVLAALPSTKLVLVDWRVAPVRPWTGLRTEDAPPRDTRPHFADLAPDEPSTVSNWIDDHPPLYYRLLASAAGLAGRVLGVGGATSSWDREVGLLRLLNVLLVAPLPLLAHATARRLTGSREVALGAAVAPLAVPQLAHLAGAVNNDNLLTLLGGLLTLVLAFVWTGDLSWRTAAIAGTVTGAALLTKVFGLIAPVWLIAAYALAGVRRAGAAEAARRCGLALLVSLVAGGWWVLGNLLSAGTAAPRPFGYPLVPGFQPHPLDWAGMFVSRISETFWGSFGIEQVRLPGALVWTASAAAIAGVLFALLRARGRRPLSGRLDVALLLVPVIGALAMVLVASWGGYVRSGLPIGIHGRYLFLGVVGAAVAVAWGWGTLWGGRRLPAAVAVAVLVLQSAGVLGVLRGYWAGSSTWERMAAVLAWSPWPAPVVAAAWGLLGVSAVVVLVGIAGWGDPEAPWGSERPRGRFSGGR